MARAAAAVVEATAAAEDTPTGTAADMATALNFVTMIGHTPLMGKHENQAPMRAYV